MARQRQSNGPHARTHAPGHMRRIRKKVYRLSKFGAKEGIPLPGRDPSIPKKLDRPKRVQLNRWEKYKRLTVDITDVHAVMAAIQGLQEDVESMYNDLQHYQPDLAYFHKKSCRLEGAEKQLEELLEAKKQIREGNGGFLLSEDERRRIIEHGLTTDENGHQPKSEPA